MQAICRRRFPLQRPDALDFVTRERRRPPFPVVAGETQNSLREIKFPMAKRFVRPGRPGLRPRVDARRWRSFEAESFAQAMRRNNLFCVADVVPGSAGI